MVKYMKKVTQKDTTVKAKAANLRVSFKKTYETANAIQGMQLTRAVAFLKNVIDKKEIVPFRKHNDGIGRKAQCKNHYLSTQGRWPEKSARILLSLLQNLESSAEYKQLDTKRIRIKHIAVLRAQQTRRRVFRAHGRINGHLRQPCHIQIIGTQAGQSIAKKLKK
jgi:large subunit ribosomal protein L17e